MIEKIEITDETKGLIIAIKERMPKEALEKIIKRIENKFKDIPIILINADVKVYALNKTDDKDIKN